MATISELAARRKSLVEQHEALINKAEAEDRELTADEAKADDKLIADIKAIDNRTGRLVSTGDIRESGKQSAGRPQLELGTQPDAKPIANVNKDPMLRYAGGGHYPYKDKESAKRVGLFLMATCGHPDSPARNRAREICKTDGIEYEAVMSSTSPTGGGGFIFDEFSTAVIELAENYGIFRQNAYRWPMASDSMLVPRLTQALTAYFLSEGSAGTASDLASDLVTITAQALGTLTQVPRELMEDSAINLAALVTKKAALALATKEDLCGFIGDGTSTYGGIRGLKDLLADSANSASLYTAVTGEVGFNTLSKTTFATVTGMFPMYPGANPKWYISKAGWAASMYRLQLAQGGSTTGDLLGGTGNATFMGYPVVWLPQGILSSAMTSTTSTILAIFGDLSLSSAFGDRRAVSMETSNEYAFTSRLTTMLCWERFAINNHTICDPVTTTQPGPVIGLKTAAS